MLRCLLLLHSPHCPVQFDIQYRDFQHTTDTMAHENNQVPADFWATAPTDLFAHNLPNYLQHQKIQSLLRVLPLHKPVAT